MKIIQYFEWHSQPLTHEYQYNMYIMQSSRKKHAATQQQKRHLPDICKTGYQTRFSLSSPGCQPELALFQIDYRKTFRCCQYHTEQESLLGRWWKVGVLDLWVGQFYSVGEMASAGLLSDLCLQSITHGYSCLIFVSCNTVTRIIIPEKNMYCHYCGTANCPFMPAKNYLCWPLLSVNSTYTNTHTLTHIFLHAYTCILSYTHTHTDLSP